MTTASHTLPSTSCPPWPARHSARRRAFAEACRLRQARYAEQGETHRSPGGHPAGALSLVALTFASLAVPAPATHPQADKLDDPTIVAIFNAANTADMETGALAAERGASREVRDFGAMLVRDHRMVRQQGRDLAARLGVTPPTPKDDQSAKDHAATMARLRGLEGAEFDRAFLPYEATRPPSSTSWGAM